MEAQLSNSAQACKVVWQDPEPAAPHRCCVDWAAVTECDGETDIYACPVCAATFEQRCPDAEEPRVA